MPIQWIDMWPGVCALTGAILALAGPIGLSADLVQSKDGSGVPGYKDTPILPWCNFHKHDPDRPLPPVVTPGQPSFDGAKAPSDALVLFDGEDLSLWEPCSWKLVDGAMEATSGDLTTKASFGSCQLHVEWRTPNPPQGDPMNRGNSGVFFMSQYELQIFESSTEKIYADGMAGALYGETPPLVNACRKPGEWQSFDVVFEAPIFQGNQTTRPATITVFHNGLLIQDHTEIRGPCAHRDIAPYKPHGPLPLKLQAHGSPVQFRNIWIRPLK